MSPIILTGGLISLITIGYAARTCAHSLASSMMCSFLQGKSRPGFTSCPSFGFRSGFKNI
jgi:hypothetical protein